MTLDLKRQIDNFLAEQASVACKWLSKQVDIPIGNGNIRPKQGVVAFNGRSGADGTPTVQVIPISDPLLTSEDSTLSERIVSAVKRPRSATVVSHFQKVGDPNWGRFVMLDIAFSENDSVLDALTNRPDSLSDAERNKLDAFFFCKGSKILSFPVPVLGSPLFSCYLDFQNPIDLSTDSLNTLEHKLREPLAAFVATTFVASLFVIGKDISEGATNDDTKSQLQLFAKQIASLLFAKRLVINNKTIFTEHSPLDLFGNGVELKLRGSRTPLSSNNFEAIITLPIFDINGGESLVINQEILLLKETIESHISHIFQFMQEAADNRKKIADRVRYQEKANLWDSTHSHVEQGLDQLRDALVSFHKVETIMDRSGAPFLRLYKDASLDLLFLPDGVCYYSRTGTHGGLMSTNKGGNDIQELRTIHEVGNPSNGYKDIDEACKSYMEYLGVLSKAKSLRFLNDGAGCKDCKEEISSLTKMAAIKQLLHRTHTNSLYDFSLAAHLALTLESHESPNMVLKVNNEFLNVCCTNDITGWDEKENKACLWRVLGNSIFHKNDFHMLRDRNSGLQPLILSTTGEDGLHPSVNVLRALMQLVGAELRKNIDNDRVVCHCISITSESTCIEVEVKCTGKLQCSLFSDNDHVGKHGLRNCVRILSNSVDQESVKCFTSMSEYIESKKTATSKGSPWFAVLITNNETNFLIRLNRKKVD